MISKNIDEKFYPFFTNIEDANYTKAFSIPVKSKDEYSLQDFKDHFKTVDDLLDAFDNIKIDEFAQDYYNYFNKIMELYEYAKLYLIPNRDEKDSDYAGYSIRTEWENIVLELYEKLRMSNSIYEDILYTLLLHDFLWDPVLDPRNPLVVTTILSKIDKLKNIVVIEDLDESAKSNDEDKLRNTANLANLSLSKIEIESDSDTNILIKKNFKSDLHHYFGNSVKSLKLYKDSDNIDNMKKELAKIYFINEIIEVKFIYNKKLTAKEKDDYPKYIALRAQILSTFKTYLNYVLSKEPSFDFLNYYEYTSPYRNVLTISQSRIKAIKSLIKGLLL